MKASLSHTVFSTSMRKFFDEIASSATISRCMTSASSYTVCVLAIVMRSSLHSFLRLFGVAPIFFSPDVSQWRGWYGGAPYASRRARLFFTSTFRSDRKLMDGGSLRGREERTGQLVKDDGM